MAPSATKEHVFEHLRTRCDQVGEVKVFVLEGSIEVSNLPNLEAMVLEACSGSGSRVLIDCAGLTHLSSGGVGAFYRFFNTCRASDGRFSICAVPSRILAVFELVGLARVIKPWADRDAAIAGLTATGIAQ